MSKFSIGYFGDGPWASRALARLCERKDEFDIRFVVPRFEMRDAELQRVARKNEIPIAFYSDINSSEAIYELQGFDCDLFVSMSFNQIMKSQFLQSARLGAINCHAGLLPRYRGRNVLNWAIMNGEKGFGVTVHYVDEGIDTGDIIRQEYVPIPNGVTYGDVLELAHTACPRVLEASLRDIVDDCIATIPQDSLGAGFYCGRRREGDEWIDWTLPSDQIFNFIRGIAPPAPGARFAIDDEIWICDKAEMAVDVETHIGTCGEVIGRSSRGVVVKTGDSAILLCECRGEGCEGGSSTVPRWPIGKRLLGKTEFRLRRIERALGLQVL
jgi:methionyl-tRNA formyltransferase